MPEPVRTRRPPPDFRRATVVGTTDRGPRLTTVTLRGPALVGFSVEAPAASVRLLLPRTDADGRLEIPEWNGNEFRFADGVRPPIRTLTPLRTDPSSGSVEVEVVRHGHGALAGWAGTAAEGDQVALAGPGAGYAVPDGADRFLVVGDESALPAIGQVLDALPRPAAVEVVVEVAAPEGRIALPHHPGATVRWCDLPPGAPPGAAMFAAVAALDVPADVAVWAAGEAAAVHRLRKLLLDERGVARSRAVIRGYWKHGRDGAGTS